MRKINVALAVVALGITVCSLPSHPTRAAESRRERIREEEKGWVKLGERQVDFKGDHDVIEVGKSEGKFTHVRLRVQDGDLELYKMKFTFGDGETFEPETKHQFKEGERTRDIDLPGHARVIKKVEFYYRSEHRRDPATIELIGKEER